MSKYIEQYGNNDEIIKTSPDEINNNLRNAKNEFILNKNIYSILEYTNDYMKNLFAAIENVNNNWNHLLNTAITYQEEINYKDEINYQGIDNSIEFHPETLVTKGVVNTTKDYLNVRTSPNGDIITSIPPKEEVTILEGDKDGWTKISFNGQEAYVCSRYINTEAPLEVIDTKTVSYTNINIRNFPNGNIISNLPYNSQIQVLANDSNGWTKILFDGKIAFVSSKGIK